MNHGTVNMKTFFFLYYCFAMQKNTFPPVCSWENFPFFLQFYAIFKKFLRTLKSRATITTQNNTQSPALKSLLEEGSRTTELCAEHSHSHGDNRERLLLFRDCWTRVISCFPLSQSNFPKCFPLGSMRTFVCRWKSSTIEECFFAACWKL